MKQVVNLVDNGRIVKSKVVETRNVAHFQTQLNTRATRVESKKVYNRKRLGKVEW